MISARAITTEEGEYTASSFKVMDIHGECKKLTFPKLNYTQINLSNLVKNNTFNLLVNHILTSTKLTINDTVEYGIIGCRKFIRTTDRKYVWQCLRNKIVMRKI